MNLSNAKLGERYNFFLDEENCVVGNLSSSTITGTVIGIQDSGDLIIGWKSNGVYPTNAWNRGVKVLTTVYVSNESEYDLVAAYPTNLQVHSKVSDNVRSGISSVSSDGLACKRCLEYYQYAVPNQKDGSLLCYSCRN